MTPRAADDTGSSRRDPQALGEQAAPDDDAGLYMSARYLRSVLEYVRDKAAPLEPVLEALGMNESEMAGPDAFIPHWVQDRVFAAAEQVTGDSNVGLHAGERIHMMNFGIVGQIALCSRSGRDLIDNHMRHQGLIGNGMRATCTRTASEITIEYTLARRAPSRHSLEYTLAAQITLARALAGPKFAASLFEFTYPEPQHADEHRRVFGCPLRFDAPRIRAHLPLSVESVPLGGGEPGVREMLEQAARQRLDSLRVRLDHADSEVERFQQYVADRLSNGAPSVHETARAMALSVRSLQRRLSRHGLSYRDLVELARKGVTERLLADQSLSLLDIALLVGFSDQTAFNRAFRRWFGTTPSQQRARHIAQHGQ
jgi:AraC-like DNA-binding protein